MQDGATAGMPSRPGPGNLARIIDHTLLKPTATAGDIARLCAEAQQFGFYAVCVHGVWVGEARRRLAGSGVAVAAVAGFPLGASATPAKGYEAARAVAEGASEVDMVINLGWLKAGADPAVAGDVERVVAAVKAENPGALVKVIIETCYLSEEEKARACRLAVQGGAGFVKTSTGFGPAGATAGDVALMRWVVGPDIGVKAAGGVRSAADALAMVAAGASRIGTSSGPAIVGDADGSGR